MGRRITLVATIILFTRLIDLGIYIAIPLAASLAQQEA